MFGLRIVRKLFFAALTALLVWALLTGVFGKYFSSPQSLFGIQSSVSEQNSDEDVLFDDDSTVDWSDPAEDVFDSIVEENSPSEEKDGSSQYEFALTPEYFSALLDKYSDKIPLKNATSSFSDGTMILSGDADVSLLSDLLGIPSALVIFLPDTVPCELCCVPQVCDGRLQVSVSRVSAGSDVLAPFLSREEVLSAVEEFLNEQLTKYLPSNYIMQSAYVTSSGLYVRFLVTENPDNS